MKLWFEARFERLKAGQADIRADFAELRRDLFHESVVVKSRTTLSTARSTDACAR